MAPSACCARARPERATQASLTIKQGFQLNFYEYVNSHRITAAKLLLADHSAQAKSITEIYFAVGFNSKSVFNTFFKRLEGMTPSQFRDQHHKAAN